MGASVICKQSTDAYLGWMIKREFKAMHSLFSNISRVRKDVGDADVTTKVATAATAEGGVSAAGRKGREEKEDEADGEDEDDEGEAV